MAELCRQAAIGYLDSERVQGSLRVADGTD
jgi:hypothetical protein